MQRGNNSRSLQELIDSYNAEIMRYSQLAQPAQQTAANQRAAGERQRESGEEEIERGRTERDYWLAKGKQGLQNGSPSMRPPRPRPEPDEPLYRPGTHMPRPEPNEPLEHPKGHHHHHKPAPHHPHSMDQHAVSANASARSMTEQELWMRELEQGLLDLQRGLEELAQGQRDLLAGQEAYRQGIAERDKWQQMSQAISAPSTDNRNIPQQSGHTLPQKGSAHHSDIQIEPLRSFLTPQSAQILTKKEQHSPHSNSAPTNPGINFSPSAQPQPQMPQSNADAPIAPISPEGRSAQSPQSIPADGMGMGYLQVGVYTARQSNPIPNARVIIFRETPEGSELYASASTDDDGKIPLVQLPTGTSSSDSVNAPFTVYNVSVTADGYYPRNELQAQIFDGITALLWVELTPLPDSAWS